MYKGLHALPARLVQKVVCRGARNHALWVKLAKMFDVPGVPHWETIFSLQVDYAGPGDSYYPIRAFPLWCQLVGILGQLNAPKNKAAFLKASGVNLVTMVVAQGLLVAHNLHNSLKTIFLKERRIILLQLLLLKLIINEHSR